MTATETSKVEMRRHERFSITLPGRIRMDENETSMNLIDLSESGLMLRMPFPVTTYRWDRSGEVRIPEIGNLAVELVWSSGHRAGFKFSDPARAKRLVSQFFAQPTSR